MRGNPPPLVQTDDFMASALSLDNAPIHVMLIQKYSRPSGVNAKYREENEKIFSQYNLDSESIRRIRAYRTKKQTNAKRSGKGFHLDVFDICYLLQEAGITIWDVGNAKYVLGRYGDTGDYEIGNCRFITQKENIAEWWNAVDKHEWSEAGRSAAKKRYEQRPKNPD